MRKLIYKLKQSFFVQKCKENKNLIIASLILAIICTFITYPGIWYSDSYSRVDFSDTVLDCIKKVLLGQRVSINVSSWLTVVPSFYIAICKFFTGNIAMYTFFQATLFFLATFLLVKKLSNKFTKIQYVFWALNPLIFCVSIYYEASILCVASIVFYILLLDNVKIKKSHLDDVIEFLFLVFFSFTIFGYRANALQLFQFYFFIFSK